MDELSSSEFRTQYARLTRPTVVTVVGRPIGRWIPEGSEDEGRATPPDRAKIATGQEDELGLLDAVAGSGAKASVPVVPQRPINPVPKPGRKR